MCHLSHVTVWVRIRDIHYLTEITWCYRQPEAAVCACERSRSYISELTGSVRSSYRSLPIFNVNRAKQWRQEDAEQRQGQRVANQIEQDEPAAESAHIPNEVRQLAFQQVVAEVHAERHVGNR
jgi:hypothetical protein